jgi:urease accessory protein UreF
MYQPEYFAQLRHYLKAKMALINLLILLDALRKNDLDMNAREKVQSFTSSLIVLMRRHSPHGPIGQTILDAIPSRKKRLHFAHILGEVNAALATDHTDIQPLEACAGDVFDAVRLMDEKMQLQSTAITRSYLQDIRRVVKIQGLKRLK